MLHFIFFIEFLISNMGSLLVKLVYDHLLWAHTILFDMCIRLSVFLISHFLFSAFGANALSEYGHVKVHHIVLTRLNLPNRNHCLWIILYFLTLCLLYFTILFSFYLQLFISIIKCFQHFELVWSFIFPSIVCVLLTDPNTRIIHIIVNKIILQLLRQVPHIIIIHNY